jgi:phosphoserine aminotransferase
MDYRNHIKDGSMLNTPPVFAVFVCLLTLRWLKAQGGVAVMEKLNTAKAELLYREIDENPLFTGTVVKEDRSKMNVCFVMNDTALEEPFLQFTKEQGIVGIKGHRLVGGFRASLYNALPISSVKVLAALMKEFALQNA